jgi:hypothetical protein
MRCYAKLAWTRVRGHHPTFIQVVAARAEMHILLPFEKIILKYLKVLNKKKIVQAFDILGVHANFLGKPTFLCPV